MTDTLQADVAAGTKETSRAAAASIAPCARALRLRILIHLFDMGDAGATCAEIETALRMTHQTASARLCELSRDYLIEDSTHRRNTPSGRKAVVWRITLAGSLISQAAKAEHQEPTA